MLAGEKLQAPRDPRVIEFIQLLREFGMRDEVAAFALIDHLSKDHPVKVLEARMAIAGGWAQRDPGAASRALLTEGAILPSNFRQQTQVKDWDIPLPNHLAIMRQASSIFRRWQEEEPHDLARFAQSQPKIWDLDLKQELSKFMPLRDLRQSDSDPIVNRNSIDAILNNPNRTARAHSSMGHEIYGKVPEGSEPAYTFEEWAARNPEEARVALSSAENWRESYLVGLSRIDRDYVNLLDLAPPERRYQSAQALINHNNQSFGRDIWPLDGRESTWQLSQGVTKQAVLEMINEGSFTTDERSQLKELAQLGVTKPVVEGVMGKFFDPIISNLKAR